MNAHHIKQMAEQLVSAGVIAAKDAKNAESALQGYWADYLVDVWSLRDVIDMADSDYDVTLDDDEAREILDMVEDRVDATQGVSWDLIGSCLTEFLKKSAASPADKD